MLTTVARTLLRVGRKTAHAHRLAAASAAVAVILTGMAATAGEDAGAPSTWTGTYDMSRSPTRAMPPWRVATGGDGRVQLRNGRLHITNGMTDRGGRAYIQRTWPLMPGGAAVLEIRFRLDPASRADGFVVNVSDGDHVEVFSFLPDRVIAKRTKREQTFDTTAAFVTYRLEIGGGEYHVLADGKPLLSGPFTHPAPSAYGSIMIGGPSGHGGGAADVAMIRYRITLPDGSPAPAEVAGRSHGLTMPAELAAAVADERTTPMPVWLNWDYNCLTLDPESIDAHVHAARDAGVQGIALRISNKGALNFRTQVGTVYHERLNAFGPDYDPLKLLIDACRRHGLTSLVWVDLFEAAYDSLILSNSQYLPQGRPGEPPLSGFPEYSEAAVREHMLKIVDEYVAYGPDKIFFCTKSSHVPRNHLDRPRNSNSGFNPPVVQRYREQHGVDPRHEPFDRRKMGLIRGEFLIDFLAAAKQRLNAAGIESIVGATVSGRLQPAGPNMLLDWRRLIERKAADALCMANSRGEYYAFYSPQGQQVFWEVARAARKAGMKFYPYILSSGTHNVITRDFGFAALLDYVPRQIEYLHALGGQGLIIHDLDLYTYDPYQRKALWRAGGMRSTPNQPLDRPVMIPQPRSLASRFPGGVPQGGFEETELLFWYAAPSMMADPDSRFRNGSFEWHADRRSRPLGWSVETMDNPGLLAVYDWKVMHDHPHSGRTYHGRSSLLLAATPEAGSHRRRTARWWTRVTLNDDVALGEQITRIRVHGLGLRDIAAVGMRIKLLDEHGQTIETLNAAAPTEGSFTWRTLELRHRFDERIRHLYISLYLTATEGGQPQGRVWFDSLEMTPAKPVSPDALTRVTQQAYKGEGSARLAARPGVDIMSVPFRVEGDSQQLRLAMRADQPMSVEVSFLHGTRQSKVINVDTDWSEHNMTLPPPPSEPTDARIIIRPRGTGRLWLDNFRLGR